MFDTPIHIIPSTGTTVHFRDAKLINDNNILHTELHREPATVKYELRNKFAYRTHDPSRLLQAASIDAVCCNSAELDLHQEARYTIRSYLLTDFSTKSIKQWIEQFDMQFDVSEMRDGVLGVPYDKRRERLLELHQASKKQSHNERENTRPTPCLKSDNTGSAAVQEETWTLVSRPHDPSTMKDYLVDKKPSRHLLILLESERSQK